MGEGLQHDDGHSPLLASTNPAAMVYDASFAYEVAVIVEAGHRRDARPEPQDRFWYLTLYNETYPMPPLPEGDDASHPPRHHRRGLPLRRRARGAAVTCGPPSASPGRCGAWPWRRRQILAERYGVAADTWAVTSWTRLRTDALEVERWNRLHPGDEPRTAAHHRRPRIGPRSGRDHHRLHALGARPGRPLRRPALLLARHGRLRSFRRPRGPALLLRGRRGPPGGGRAAPAGHGRVASTARWSSRPSTISASSPPPGSALHPLSTATKLASTSSAPSGTRSVSVRASASRSIETSKKAQHAFSR